jgi:hypothetical protein
VVGMLRGLRICGQSECFVAHHWEKLQVKLADGAKIR